MNYLTHFHRNEAETNIHINRLKRIDHILYIEGIVRVVRQCDIASFHKIIISDHCSTTIDINKGNDLNNTINNELNPSSKTINLQYPKTVLRYKIS